jgi:hypothetical protein
VVVPDGVAVRVRLRRAAEAKMGLTPKHWAEFQHYKNRSPRWIKLHHKLLDDFAFSRLPLASKALAPMLWLLASEYDDGNITAPMEEIAFRLRVTEEELRAALIPLIDGGFFNDASNTLADCKEVASNMLAGRYQTASPEKRREEIELESDIRAVAAATRTYKGQDFEEFWKTYPKRAGANPKTPARQKFLAAVNSGVSPAEITQAARRYAGEQRQLGKIGTEHVAMASTWLNQKRWGDYPATAPPSKKPAYLTPPPGCEPLEVILEKVEKPNATEERKKIRGHSAVGTNRSN